MVETAAAESMIHRHVDVESHLRQAVHFHEVHYGFHLYPAAKFNLNQINPVIKCQELVLQQLVGLISQPAAIKPVQENMVDQDDLIKKHPERSSLNIPKFKHEKLCQKSKAF